LFQHYRHQALLFLWQIAQASDAWALVLGRLWIRQEATCDSRFE
jgi:hypothetical protein